MSQSFFNYDVIVIGAGHAGCEAAHAAATLGSKVLLITMNMGTIAQMSCNPAMGGVAKGQIVREIDALGGMSGIVTDETMIQFRLLNRSKGPAMWSPRAQSDRVLFALKWRSILEENKNISFWQDSVISLIIKGSEVKGVNTALGASFLAPSIILTAGTFMNGRIHVGLNNYDGGRMGEKASMGITEQLMDFGFQTARMKTGTPPRIDGRTLDYAQMEEQFGDEEISSFSYLPTKKLSERRSCFITYTNPEVHNILRGGFDSSPMYSGNIKGLGPRYCPSIEDKINRFAERDRHQIFVEPEGKDTVEVYVNGFSTSLPLNTQLQALRLIPGFAKAKIFRPGYAIEYDFFQPTQLSHSLETKLIKGLFFAGQINGTTGYEEAACQGLMAGINAHKILQNENPLVLKRSEAYIGVLIDDLVTKGTDEPYRMFTSRAEYRITLRQDNADLRLTIPYQNLALISQERLNLANEKSIQRDKLITFLKGFRIAPSEANPILQKLISASISEAVKLINLIARPQVSFQDFSRLEAIQEFLTTNDINRTDVFEEVNINIKYSSYIAKEADLANKLNAHDLFPLPKATDFTKIVSLSSEAKEKLNRFRPETLGQASRISGISPADLSILLVHFGR